MGKSNWGHTNKIALIASIKTKIGSIATFDKTKYSEFD